MGVINYFDVGSVKTNKTAISPQKFQKNILNSFEKLIRVKKIN